MACKILVFSPNCNFTSKQILLTVRCGWSISEVYMLPWILREKWTAHLLWDFVHNKKRHSPPQLIWCNLLVFFKCFGAIRDCVKILQTFPKKQAHQHFKFILACIPNISKNLRVIEAITCEFLSSFFPRSGCCLACHVFVESAIWSQAFTNQSY